MKNSLKTSELTVTDTSTHFWAINLGLGGGYPGPVDDKKLPVTLKVDYVRHYVWRESCADVTCSSHGTCNTDSMLCECNSGWTGSDCSQDIRSFSTNFATATSLDFFPDGLVYGTYTGFTHENDIFIKSKTSSHKGLTLTLSQAGCPESCYKAEYSGGAWESRQRFSYGTFEFTAQSTNVAGTGLSLSAAGEGPSVEKCAFILSGESPKQVSLVTTSKNKAKTQKVIDLDFDASEKYHTYAFTFSSTETLWLIDGVQVYKSTEMQPQALRLGPEVFYAYQPDWYGKFVGKYKGPYKTYVSSFNWKMT